MSCDLPKIVDADGEVVTWREGDTFPPIGFTLQDGELVASYTITLRVIRPDGTTLVISSSNPDGSYGEFEFAADSLQAGENQRAEIHRVNGGELWTSPAFGIDVEPRVGT